MTYAEYVAFDGAADARHEYVNGRVYAMAGGSPEHARLAVAVSGDLRVALRGKPCVPFSSDLRVRVAATGRATYPDVTFVCGKLERDTGDAVTNPTVIVEVLSDSTEGEDRGDKWAHYQRIPSLREYVLVSQKAARVEVFSRDATQPELWHYRDHGSGARAAIESLGVVLEVDALYENRVE